MKMKMKPYLLLDRGDGWTAWKCLRASPAEPLPLRPRALALHASIDPTTQAASHSSSSFAPIGCDCDQMGYSRPQMRVTAPPGEIQAHAHAHALALALALDFQGRDGMLSLPVRSTLWDSDSSYSGPCSGPCTPYLLNGHSLGHLRHPCL